ncbi:MAG: hypothetical protein DMF63_17855 [Acidobacteria bacterium]|nr:MAG: hypothetical protein DMF63_17855 [Acidobacteriota bacterium]
MNYYNYFTEIEDTFVRRRGKHLLLSPIDWAMIEGWRDRGVPLHIVIRSIENVFDGFDKNPGPRSIKGLLYCKEEVEAQFLEWSSMQAGKAKSNEGSVEFSPERIVEHIDSVIAELRNAQNPDLAEDIDRAISRLQELAANHSNDIESADRALSDIESFIEQSLLTRLDTSVAEKEVVAQLRPYKSQMQPDAYKQTSRVMILKRLRDDHGIPRLSLFYL